MRFHTRTRPRRLAAALIAAVALTVAAPAAGTAISSERGGSWSAPAYETERGGSWSAPLFDSERGGSWSAPAFETEGGSWSGPAVHGGSWS